ncbi:MAG: replication-associated recombination protein A [Schleiferiaceae bacterium]|jgi:putative ATPase|nr:replication-associated recombination protein A [Schleiferiaceae bacterium]MDP4627893.1 replication-associated recombination protein A [Schleiferiaceae bacterium]MDP4728761.1 replication-associated recombination protein A [Schleiferiaceae bacterium]MDP4859522.1 replication-associated recombination protein A [Schleiferiaceae bacterium]MDP4901463.1 replication-associated recombination protein A [Schleiferiaceae bacterium]
MEKRIPLAERRRPQQLADMVGQSHLVGERGALTASIQTKRLPSLLLWGPPGVGKTTLALLLAGETGMGFTALSAISSGVKEVREVLQQAEQNSLFRSTNGHLLFIDEIHRFSKAQQDGLLAAVEKGVVTLVGATTENPSFEVIPALLSRCQLYVLQSLSDSELQQLAERALAEDEYLRSLNVAVREWEILVALAGGDGRKMLNQTEWVLEQAAGQNQTEVTNEFVASVGTRMVVHYDKGGEAHYDLASALIKSIRGSDPDAALYWAARMLAGGEPPHFIARRLLISASEDIGNANPNALVLANTTFDAVEKLGMPEARIPLGQCIVYLASSPKSNASYLAMDAALAAAEATAQTSVPLHLRNAPTRAMKNLGYGVDYSYPHDFPGHFTPQNYFPDRADLKPFYVPANNPKEQEFLRYLKHCWPERY